MSPTHLQRVFKAVIGVSPKEYGDAERLKTFKARLREGRNVTQATFEAGYGSTSRIHDRIDGGLGMTPRAYRAGGAGEIIVYAVRTTKLGDLMMAATERGVCFVSFGESPAALEAQLAAEYPKAVLRDAEAAAHRALDDWIAALDENLSNGRALPDVPLDLRGTAFQIRVWRFLLSVKPGDVVSYSEIAAGVDAPLRGPLDARRAGIETVFQELAVIPLMDVEENFFLGREICAPGLFGRLKLLSKGKMRTQARDEFASLRVGIPSVRQRVGTLSGGQRQSVAVACAVAWSRKIVIMDEPTAALGVKESRGVQDLIKRVRDRGIAVILISQTCRKSST